MSIAFKAFRLDMAALDIVRSGVPPKRPLMDPVASECRRILILSINRIPNSVAVGRARDPGLEVVTSGVRNPLASFLFSLEMGRLRLGVHALARRLRCPGPLEVEALKCG